MDCCYVFAAHDSRVLGVSRLVEHMSAYRQAEVSTKHLLTDLRSYSYGVVVSTTKLKSMPFKTTPLWDRPIRASCPQESCS